MEDPKEPPRFGILSRYVVPAVIAAVTTAGTVAALDRLEEPATQRADLSNDTVRDIQFTSFSDDEVTRAIRNACILTGCDQSSLHPMIEAYADAMDPDQLAAARWAQVRLLMKGMQTLDAAAPGSVAAEMAHLELTAAARIAQHYTTKMNAGR